VKDFVLPGASYEVNASSRTRLEVVEACRPVTGPERIETFESLFVCVAALRIAAEAVYDLMEMDSFKRYSDIQALQRVMTTNVRAIHPEVSMESMGRVTASSSTWQ
jgi:hypothetical protein